jgi:hypothetical protein
VKKNRTIALVSRLLLAGLVCFVCLFNSGGVSAREPAAKLPTSKSVRAPKPKEAGISVAPIIRTSQGTVPIQTPQAVPKPKYRTSGREFYVAFLSTIGNDPLSTPSPKTVYIVSRSHTRGKISHVGGTWSKSFECNPKVATPIILPSWSLMDRMEMEVKVPRLFMVTTDDDVSVYAMSLNYLSSDGYLVLPKEALGTNHVISSLRNALWYYQGAIAPWNANANVPRSEFGVAAIENGTEITIELTADSWSGKYRKGLLHTFTLNRGEVIQFSARDTGIKAMVDYFDPVSGVYIPKVSWVGKDGNNDCDLTGSVVASTKPVVVLSGHERASAPDDLEFAWKDHPDVSRDHLIEQMPPVDVWGQEFIAIGAKRDDQNNRPPGGDMIRVISAFDNTLVYRNGAFVDSLGRGEFTQFMSGDISHIEATNPVLVTKYLLTCNSQSIDSLYLGDPDMTVVPPIENMSTFYSVPTVPVANFTHHFVSVLIDSAAVSSTTLNSVLVDKRTLKSVPNTRFLYGRYQTFGGEQRLESSLPGYAETYGYGAHDSYSFSGGGDFKYLRELAARDLDFGTLMIGSQKDSITTVYVDVPPSPLADTLEIFRYSWDTGDTNAFAILDTIATPMRIAPGESLPVRFRFTPPALGKYSARVRVWSSNYRDVFINVHGIAADRGLQVIPPVIKFPKTRVGLQCIDSIHFISVGTSAVTLTKTSWQDQIRSGAFGISDYPKVPASITVGDTVRHLIGFNPMKTGVFRDTLYFENDGIPSNTPMVILEGEGIQADIVTTGIDFGELRVGTRSIERAIPIQNVGTDSTTIDTIYFVGGNVNEFELVDMTVPSFSKPIPIYAPGQDTSIRFYEVIFKPAVPLPLVPPRFDPDGRKYVLVKVVTGVGEFVDTLFGRGVEPVVFASKDTLDFGIIVDPQVTALYDTLALENKGSDEAYIDSAYTFTSSYTVTNASLINNGATIVPFLQKVDVRMRFNITEPGIFLDSIYQRNDSRWQPVVYLRANVKAGLQYNPFYDLGVAQDCNPINTVVRFTNPSVVPIRIDSFWLAEGFGGFTVLTPDTNHIIVPPKSTYDFQVEYRFPDDSISGAQSAILVLKQPLGGEAIGFRYDTVRFSVTRKIDILSLSASQVPSYKPNALDEPFKMPVYLKGDRGGKGQLDNISIKINFGNDMVAPIGIDRSGSLTENTSSNPVPPQPSPVWDEATHTYTVKCEGLNISTNLAKNTLLFTVICKAFLTKDTETTIIQELQYDADPACAFRVIRDSLRIAYADECGDNTIRGVMLSNSPQLIVSPPQPDPVSLSGNSSVQIRYFAPRNVLLSWKLVDMSGTVVAYSSEMPISAGNGQVQLSRSDVSVAGSYIIEFTARDQATGTSGKTTTKFTVVK